MFPAATRINKGRRAEARARNPRYWQQLNTHRSFRAFGPPEYIDEAGRYYRLADPMPVLPGGLLTLDVKLPRRAVPWFPAANAGSARPRVTLRAAAGGAERTIVIYDSYIMGPAHRTGHVHIRPEEWQ